MYSDPRAEGMRRDAARRAAALSEEVRRRRALEAECEVLRGEVAFWRRLALAVIRPMR